MADYETLGNNGHSFLVTAIFTKIKTLLSENCSELRINCGSLSSLPTTISDSRITSDMEFSGYYEASNGSAITSDLTVTTADGSVTISGSLSGSTTLRIGLVHVT